MFDLIFQGAQAWNQVGFFIGALVFLGIGGLILGDFCIGACMRRARRAPSLA